MARGESGRRRYEEMKARDRLPAQEEESKKRLEDAMRMINDKSKRPSDLESFLLEDLTAASSGGSEFALLGLSHLKLEGTPFTNVTNLLRACRETAPSAFKAPIKPKEEAVEGVENVRDEADLPEVPGMDVEEDAFDRFGGIEVKNSST